MSRPQLRVKLVVAAGIIGTSLLTATLTGCTSTQSNSMPGNGMYGQAAGAYGQAGGIYGQPGVYGQATRGNAGQQAVTYVSPPQSAYPGFAGGQNGWTTQNQQAFMQETQRLGAQPNLTAQDVVAMSRSGYSDSQIAAAVQQRGASLSSTPGAAQYLAQNGVNPNVLTAGAQMGGAYPGTYAGQTPFATASTGSPSVGSPTTGFTSGTPAGTTYPLAQSEQGPTQAAGIEASAPSGFEAPGATTTAGMPAPSWHPMTR